MQYHQIPCKVIDGSHINYDSANEFVGNDVSVGSKRVFKKKEKIKNESKTKKLKQGLL